MKAEAKKLRERGLTYTRIAGRFGVAESTIRRWVDPRQAALDRENHLRWRERNLAEVQKRDRNYRRQQAALDAKPSQARTCRCEKPWHTREPVCDGSYEDWCLACSRSIR